MSPARRAVSELGFPARLLARVGRLPREPLVAPPPSHGVEKRLVDLGLVLPAAPPLREGLAHGIEIDGRLVLSRCTGFVAEDSWDDEAIGEAARQAVLLALAFARSAIGDLNRIRQVIRLAVFVEGPVLSGARRYAAFDASALLVEIFGITVGRHAISTERVASLTTPFSVAVDLEFAVFKLFSNYSEPIFP